jgi:hypothetical protein
MPSGIAVFASPHLELIDGAGENAGCLPWIEPCFSFLIGIIVGCDSCMSWQCLWLWTMFIKGSSDAVL